jgi:EAL domain-containing protein (putative c-di-GMP-specific phosphodiesterase class I)
MEFGVSPDRIALEVSHTSALADDAATLSALRSLDADGFHLVIDDYGTGYSTAARLASLPFDEVKIDTRFVRKVQRSDAAAALVESMVYTARDLDIECTAEGVENQQILDKLTGWGCDFAQGYYIARPMPADELEHWLKASV